MILNILINTSIRWSNLNILSILNNHLINYPTGVSIGYAWGFGSLAGMALVIQIITGIFVAMQYTGYADLSFSVIDILMRDVWNGWILRYVHANGASFFFIVVYLHIIRGLYYGSYISPRGWLWSSGVIIFLIMVITAFLGYVLPWGQMSLWGATVITNLVSAIPIIGDAIVIWLWGGYSVGNATLIRFYSLHFLLPFILSALALLHLVLLHINGSSNRLGINDNRDKLDFYPYCVVKDLFVLLILIFCYIIIVIEYPNLLGHSDNSIEANIMFTPAHIVPEWYFLPFYGILRSIPFKLGGVLLMLFSILSLLTLPILSNSTIRSVNYKIYVKWIWWFFISLTFLLGVVGQENVEWPYDIIALISTCLYFFIILIIIPNLN